MTTLRKQLDDGRRMYASASYPGDLAADVLRGRQWVKWIIGGGSGLAAAIAAIVVLVVHLHPPAPAPETIVRETPAAIPTEDVPTVAGMIPADVEVVPTAPSGVDLAPPSMEMPSMSLTMPSMEMPSMPAMPSFSGNADQKS